MTFQAHEDLLSLQEVAAREQAATREEEASSGSRAPVTRSQWRHPFAFLWL